MEGGAVQILPALLTIREAAQYLHVSEGLIYKLMRTKELRAVRFGGATRIRRGEVDRLIERKTTR